MVQMRYKVRFNSQVQDMNTSEQDVAGLDNTATDCRQGPGTDEVGTLTTGGQMQNLESQETLKAALIIFWFSFSFFATWQQNLKTLLMRPIMAIM